MIEHYFSHFNTYLAVPKHERIVGNHSVLGRCCAVELIIGNGSGIDKGKIILAPDTVAKITIDKFTSIGKDVVFQLGTDLHRTSWGTVFDYNLIPWDESFGPKPGLPIPNGRFDIHIGSEIWIGDDSRICSGVTIGDGAVIGAGTVVTEDVPPYSFYVGNPGRVKKYRFSPEEIEFLLASRWWDLPQQSIKRLGPFLASSDIGRLKQAIELEATYGFGSYYGA